MYNKIVAMASLIDHMKTNGWDDESLLKLSEYDPKSYFDGQMRKISARKYQRRTEMDTCLIHSTLDRNPMVRKLNMIQRLQRKLEERGFNDPIDNHNENNSRS